MNTVKVIVDTLRSPTVLTILLITGCYLVLGWVIAINGPALDDFQEEFEVSKDAVSLVTALMFVGMMIGNVVATWLLERPSQENKKTVYQKSFVLRALTFMGECGRGNIPQAVLFQGVVIMSGFFFLISVSTRAWSYGLVLVFYMCTGIGNSLIDIGANTIVSALDPSVAGSLLNLLHLGFGLGATMAPYVFALFHMDKGYHIAFLVVSIGGGVMFLLLHFFLPRATIAPQPTKSVELNIRIDDNDNLSEEKEKEKEEKEKEEKKRKKSERSSAGLLDNAQTEGISDDVLVVSSESEITPPPDAIVAVDNSSLSLSSSSPTLSSPIFSSTSALHPPRSFEIEENKKESKSSWEFRHLLNIDFAMLMMAILSYNGSEIIIGEWAYDLLEELGHEKYGTVATSLFWAGLLSGRLANSVLGQKFPGLKGTFLLLRVSIAGAVLFPMLVVIFPIPPFSLVLFYFSGFSYGGIFPFIVTIVAAVFPDSSGSTATALGTTFFCANFGATVFPYLAGFVASHASVRTGMALAPFAILLVGFAIMVVWWKVKAKF